jgi:hypothetical protein
MQPEIKNVVQLIAKQVIWPGIPIFIFIGGNNKADV